MTFNTNKHKTLLLFKYEENSFSHDKKGQCATDSYYTILTFYIRIFG